VNTPPSISLVTISYNQAPFLEKCIQSVLDQNYPRLEYIVIDGGSTDGSVDILRAHERHFAHWVSEKDRGQSHALNKGFARCTGDLMGWLNSDDYFLPGALARFAEAWHKNPAAAAWVGDAHLVDEQGRTVKIQQPGRLERDALADWEVNGFSQPACLFNRTAWRKSDGIDESLFIAMDLDLWLKLAAHGPFERIPHPLAGATIHAGAKTQAHVNLKHVETWMVMMRHGYADLAKRRMLETLDSVDDLRRKRDKLVNLPFYRLLRPLVKAFLGKPGTAPASS
jgi:glycosyltransferase involved in cell wall biosynthesis